MMVAYFLEKLQVQAMANTRQCNCQSTCYSITFYKGTVNSLYKVIYCTSIKNVYISVKNVYILKLFTFFKTVTYFWWDWSSEFFDMAKIVKSLSWNQRVLSLYLTFTIVQKINKLDFALLSLVKFQATSRKLNAFLLSGNNNKLPQFSLLIFLFS